MRKPLNFLPAARLLTCPDYPLRGQPVPWETKVGERRVSNIPIRGGGSEEDFVKLRTRQDRTLEAPKLMLPSMQVNIRAGDRPPNENNGVSQLKTSLHAL